MTRNVGRDRSGARTRPDKFPYLPGIRLGIVVSVIVTALLATGCASAAPATSASSRGLPGTRGELELSGTKWVRRPPCAWPTAVNSDTIPKYHEFNNSNPDTASAYWLLFFTVQSGLRITLSGQFPDSRYMSFEVYDSQGEPFTTNGVGSALADYQIAPDPRSVNPWQDKARPGGKFTMTLRSDVEPGEVNTLPLAPAGTTAGSAGVIFFRVYAPSHGNPWRVPVPHVTLTRNGLTTQLPACPAKAIMIPANAGQLATVGATLPTAGKPTAIPSTTASTARKPTTPATPGASGVIEPFAGHKEAGPGHTPDVYQAYLFAAVLPTNNGDVVVIRGKAPTTPRSASPSPWPASGMDLRYWSLCIDELAAHQPVVVNHLPDGKVDLGCRYDSQVALDKDGDYTIVIGTESQRRAIERIAGATFLPFSLDDPAQPYVLSLRNLLPSATFAEATQDVPTNASPASAAAVMGPYYPRIAFCSLATLAHSGVIACRGGTS